MLCQCRFPKHDPFFLLRLIYISLIQSLKYIWSTTSGLNFRPAHLCNISNCAQEGLDITFFLTFFFSVNWEKSQGDGGERGEGGSKMELVACLIECSRPPSNSTTRVIERCLSQKEGLLWDGHWASMVQQVGWKEIWAASIKSIENCWLSPPLPLIILDAIPSLAPTSVCWSLTNTFRFSGQMSNIFWKPP